MKNQTPKILALTLLGVALAGCNRDNGDTTATTEPVPAPVVEETVPAPAPADTKPVVEPSTKYTVDRLVVGGEGRATYLTDSKGRRLYMLKDDDAGTKCVGDCLKTWRAVVGPAPAVEVPNVPPTAITTVTRSDGTTQVAYYGHPLYYYDDGTTELPEVNVVATESPWGRWYLVSPTGETIELKEGVPTTSSPTAAGADGRDLPTQSPGGRPGDKG